MQKITNQNILNTKTKKNGPIVIFKKKLSLIWIVKKNSWDVKLKLS